MSNDSTRSRQEMMVRLYIIDLLHVAPSLASIYFIFTAETMGGRNMAIFGFSAAIVLNWRILPKIAYKFVLGYDQPEKK